MKTIAYSLLFGMTTLASPALAEHFDFDLSIQTPKEKTSTQTADTDPPPQGTGPRLVCHAAKGDPLIFQFFMNSNFPHNAIKAVTVRYYITPEEKVGQNTVPARGGDTVLEGYFTMDFKPKTGRVGLRQLLHIDKPGVYLVRVQSENSDSDHEHFVAIDLKID